jgi:hypothetical protein
MVLRDKRGDSGQDDREAGRADTPLRSDEPVLIALYRQNVEQNAEIARLRVTVEAMLAEFSAMRGRFGSPQSPPDRVVERLRPDLAFDRIHRILLFNDDAGRRTYNQSLIPADADILGYLLDAHGAIKCVRDIARAVGVAEHTVLKGISRLRVHCLDNTWTLICTYRGVGYAVIVAV